MKSNRPFSRPHQEDSFSPFRQVSLIAGIFFFIFLSRLILAPFLPEVEQDFGVNHAEAASLFFFLSLGMSLSQIFSGFVAQRVMHRNTVIIAISGAGLSWILMSMITSFLWMKIMMFFLGTAIGLYLPSGISTITSILSPQNWGKGLAIHEIAPNSSYILAPAIAALVQGILPWRMVVAALGLAALGMGVVFAISGRGGFFAGESPRPQVLKEVLAKPQFWLLVALFSVAVSMTIGIYSMIPVYLVDAHGFSQSWANNLLSISRVPCLFMALCAGFIIDRVGANKTIVLAMSVTGVFTLVLGLGTGVPLLLGVLIQPLFGICFFPAGFTAISTVFHAHIRNVAISLIVPMSTVVGTGLVPTLLGWFGDQGRFPSGFALVGVLILMGLVFVRFLKLTASEKE